MSNKVLWVLGCLAIAMTVGAPQARAQDGGLNADIYGFLKTGYTAARGGLESFGRQNASAPTAASLPLLAPKEGEWTSTFQVAQSRLGVHMDPVPELRTTLEVDFINFDRSSPTVQALPRLRIATLQWKPNANQSVTIGQTWDLFSPLNGVHSNFVGNNFAAGNAGFMRQQVIWRGTFGALELGGAAGMPGANASADVGNLERGLVPTVALLAGVRPAKGLRLGVTGIGTQMLYGDAERTRTSLGGNAWAEYKAHGWLVRGEGYVGQNLANLGLLTLSQGHMDADVREAGGWLALKKVVADEHVFHLTGGVAQVLNTEDMLVGYSAVGDGTFVRARGQGLGIERNFTARAGYVWKFAPGASFFVEPLWFATLHKLNASERNLSPAQRQSAGLELGAIYRF
jgi:hypothetical protein